MIVVDFYSNNICSVQACLQCLSSSVCLVTVQSNVCAVHVLPRGQGGDPQDIFEDFNIVKYAKIFSSITLEICGVH